MPYTERRILIYMEDTRQLGGNYDTYGAVFQRFPSKMMSSPQKKTRDETCDYPLAPNPLKSKIQKESSTEEKWNERYNENGIDVSPRTSSLSSRYVSPKKDVYVSQYRTSPDIFTREAIAKNNDVLICDNKSDEFHINTKIYPRLSHVKCTPLKGTVLNQDCKECCNRGCIGKPVLEEAPSFREKVKLVEETRVPLMKPCQLSCCYTMCHDGDAIYKQSKYGECRESPSAFGIGYSNRETINGVCNRRKMIENLSPVNSLHSPNRHSIDDVYAKELNVDYKTHRPYELYKISNTAPGYPLPNHGISKINQSLASDNQDSIEKYEQRGLGNEYRKESVSRRYENINNILKKEKNNTDIGYTSSEYQGHVMSKSDKEKNSNVRKWQNEAGTNRFCSREVSTTPLYCNHRVCNENIKSVNELNSRTHITTYNPYDERFTPNNYRNGLNRSSHLDNDRKFYNNQAFVRSDSSGHLSDDYYSRSVEKKDQLSIPNGTNPFFRIQQMKVSPHRQYIENRYYLSSPDHSPESTLVSSPIHSNKSDNHIHDNKLTLSNQYDRFMSIRDHHHLPPPRLLRVPPDRRMADISATAKHRMMGLFGNGRVPHEHVHPMVSGEKKRTKSNKCLHLWQFLRKTLDEEEHKEDRCIEWTDRQLGEFRLINTTALADRWGQSKNSSCMTYEKMARAMRYYYNTNILEKVPHKRLHFRFSSKISTNISHESNNLKNLPTPTDNYQNEHAHTKENNINTPDDKIICITDENNKSREEESTLNQSKDISSSDDGIIKKEVEPIETSSSSKITTTTVVTPLEHIPPVSSTPDMWSDTDSAEDLIIDTDSEE